MTGKQIEQRWMKSCELRVRLSEDIEALEDECRAKIALIEYEFKIRRKELENKYQAELANL